MAAARVVVENLFRAADIQINGARAWDIQVHDERFFSSVLVAGTLGFGESDMDGWDYPALDDMCTRAIAARLDSGLRPRFAISSAYCTRSCSTSKRSDAGAKSVASTTTSEMNFSKRCSIPGCNIPALSSATATISRRPNAGSWS